MNRFRQIGAMALAGLGVQILAVGVAGAKEKPPVTIQILNFSDFHGQLDPVLVGTSPVGGAAALSSYFKADRANQPLTLTLTAGDAFGATPALSNFFLDEPAVKALNLMGLTADTFGNHNFDRGVAHLQGLIDLADYDFISANLPNLEDNLVGVAAPYKIYRLDKVKVAVIGITNEEAPSLVFPGNFGTMTPTNSAAAAAAARRAAREEGASVFIAIVHKGVTGQDVNGNATGPLIDFANAVTGFDLILGDHTDVQYQGIHNGALVTENLSHSESYSRVLLQVSQTGGRRVIAKSVEFVTPFVASAPGGPDPAVEAMLAPYRTQLTAIFNTPVGSSTVAIPRTDLCGNAAGRTCESLIGDVVTDAMRTAYGTDFAITNSGGIRANLTCPTLDLATDFCPAFVPPPFPITAGQVFTVLPFGNLSTTVTVTGAELKDMLEAGVSTMPAVNGRFPQVSGLCFTYEITNTPATIPLNGTVVPGSGQRVTSGVRQAADGSCSGSSIDFSASASYTLVINDFMANGGDGYPPVMAKAVTRAPLDSDATSYVTARSPLAPANQGRIVCTDANGATAPNCPTILP